VSIREPEFVRASDLLHAAFEFAYEAHHGPRRRDDTDLAHPLEVARELRGAGAAEPVLAAALLHDVVEDTATAQGEVRERFGQRVGALVAALTEDPEIEDYPRRKADLRRQVIAGGPDAAAIFVADKLVSARALDPGHVPPDKLEHYRETLRLARRSFPRLPGLSALEGELRRLAP
jgi:GTP pyrophosphokinase